MKFTNSQNRDRHLKEIHQHLEKTKCPKCNQTFVRKEDMTTHIKTIHENKNSDIKCEKCDKTFSKISNLNRHKSNVHDRFKPFFCPKPGCPEGFSRKSNYERHMERDKHSKLVTCRFCGNIFKCRSKGEEKKHYVKEWGERPHSCVRTEKKRDPNVNDNTRYFTYN